jgi:hypothetical protein
LVNRILHVVPPRRHFRASASSGALKRPHDSVTGMSGVMRLSLRLPSALLLLRALYLVAVKLPLVQQWVPSLATGDAQMDDAQVLWTVFLALGLQSVTECFCKALNNDLHTQTSVNLLSVSGGSSIPTPCH